MTFREYSTTCPRDCYDTCFLKVRVDEYGKIVCVKGDPESSITKGITCPRAAGDHVRVYRNRVLGPAKRIEFGDKRQFNSISWETALDSIGDKLRTTISEYGAESVLLLDYSGNTGLLTQHFPKRLWNALGVTKTDYGLCTRSGRIALKLHYGLDYGVRPEELLNKKLIVYWGFNALVSAMHIWSLSRIAQRKNKAKIVSIDPRKSRTSEKADIWVSPRPGTDCVLAFGIAQYLIEHEYVDLDFIEKYTLGYDKLKEKLAIWTPEKVENITGISDSQLEELGQTYGELKPSATMIGIGVQQTVQGGESVRAIAFLTTLLGLHRGFFYSNTSGLSVDESYLMGKGLSNRKGKIVSQVALGEQVRGGDFKFIYIYNMNPVLTLPGQVAFREGLLRNDVFCVVHETHWTETTNYADVVLPAPTFLEKSDIVLAWAHDNIRLSHKVIEPEGQSKDEVWVMQQLAKRLDLQEKWLFEDPWSEVGKAVSGAFESGTFENLLEGDPLKLKYRPLSEYQTPSGKVEFYSSIANDFGLSPLPEYQPFGISPGEFILLNSSLPKYIHTQFQEVYGNVPAEVHISPADAKKLGIDDTDTVKLYNEDGQMLAKARIDDGMPNGVLWSPKEIIGLNNKSQNSLTSAIPQRLGGGSTFNSTLIRISKETDYERG